MNSVLIRVFQARMHALNPGSLLVEPGFVWSTWFHSVPFDTVCWQSVVLLGLKSPCHLALFVGRVQRHLLLRDQRCLVLLGLVSLGVENSALFGVTRCCLLVEPGLFGTARFRLVLRTWCRLRCLVLFGTGYWQRLVLFGATQCCLALLGDVCWKTLYSL